MATERFRTRTAVLLLLWRQRQGRRQILLQQRQNTGYADGYWDFAASGHLEAGESLRAALAREAREEIGITIAPADLRFVTVIHKYVPSLADAYFNFYFEATAYQGEPFINEPEKCAALQWFDLTALPQGLIADRRVVLQYDDAKVPYAELNWGAEVEPV